MEDNLLAFRVECEKYLITFLVVANPYDDTQQLWVCQR